MPIRTHNVATRNQIADALQIDRQYAYQICAGIKTASPALARRWHEVSPSDQLWELRPKDWHVIWPELVNADGSPPIALDVHSLASEQA